MSCSVILICPWWKWELDLAIPRRIKKLMSSFKGRTFAYDEAMKSGEGEVKHALIRNIYGKVPAPYTEELK